MLEKAAIINIPISCETGARLMYLLFCEIAAPHIMVVGSCLWLLYLLFICCKLAYMIYKLQLEGEC
jgi:hypothetical protein